VPVPRKTQLPQNELEILARLKSCRRRLELPRRLFAKAATLDSSVIIRLELGRMPLRFGVARALCSAHSINAEWLATGDDEGNFITPFGLPIVRQIKADDDALFSDVFKTHIAPILFSSGDGDDDYARNEMSEYWSQIIDNAFEKVSRENFAALDGQLRAVLHNLIGPVPAPRSLEPFRKYFAAIAAHRSERGTAGGNKAKELEYPYLTEKATSVLNTDVQNQWHRLKQRIQKVAGRPGGKSALAKFLGVDLTQLSKWLTDSQSAREPGADYTLKMLHWVKERESK
jgi:transcriptional regulator with XRE-family HTH domain